MPLNPKDRDRLEKLLNMLGSPVDGEIANAGRMIQKMATRYNVTPADLCLSNRIGSPPPEQPQQQARRPGAWGESPFKNHWSGRSWDDVFQERDERQRGPRYEPPTEEEIRRGQERREAGERMRREQERQDGEKARQRRQEEARAKSARKAKSFPGTYYGLLGRLKGIYDNHFDDLESWKLDFIEIVLTHCKADRELTIRQREMAKAVIKYSEDREPLV